MSKFSSVEEFVGFRHRILTAKQSQHDKPTLIICAGTGGQASGANDVMRIIKRYIIERNLREKIDLRITGCQGFCEMDPFILVEPGRHLYPKIKMEDVPKIIEAALGGSVDEELIYKDPRDKKLFRCQNDIPFF
ncbi:MAG: (2Fe-2S) ferredoxin domain-containing protein, partial [Bacteroidetes bacterium]|nr:(2Fe-2S) ferredoxin domain-containing protein [Bacteroidota bacterium]